MLASDFTVKRVCRVIGINRSGFYKWRRRRMTPTERQKRRLEDIELFNDFHIKESDDVRKSVEEYIFFFNNERPAYALDYLTPRQFKEKYYGTVSTFC